MFDNEIQKYFWVLLFILASKWLLIEFFKQKRQLIDVISNAFLLLFMTAVVVLERDVIFYSLNFTSVFITLMLIAFAIYFIYQIYKLNKKRKTRDIL